MKDALTLDFVLTCSIKLGTAPTTADCEQRYTDDPSGGLLASGVAGRKRRQTEQTEFTQTTGTYNFKSVYKKLFIISIIR